MTSAPAPLPERIRVERSGDELLVLDAHRGLLHRIAAIDVQAIAAGHAAAYEADLAPEVLAAVVEALAAPADDRRWDRRRVLTSGAALAGAGVTTVLLPTAAVAASVGLVSAGGQFNNGLVDITSVSLGSFVRQGSAVFSVNQEAFGTWEVPTGVTQVQIEATSTSGTPPFPVVSPAPTGYAGAPGRGVRAVATVSVTPGTYLVVRFTGDRNYSNYQGGGAGAAAVGIGFCQSDGSAGQWLVVAGGGGGGGLGGRNLNISGGYDRTVAYTGGAGGDAGRGGTAWKGGDGLRVSTVTATGGLGGSTSAPGAGGSSSQQPSANAGGSPTRPQFFAADSTLGLGGQTFSSADGNVGGNGGCGYYGGGAGAYQMQDLSGSGGGGGSSFIRSSLVVSGTLNWIEHINRAHSMGPKVSVYY